MRRRRRLVETDPQLFVYGLPATATIDSYRYVDSDSSQPTFNQNLDVFMPPSHARPPHWNLHHSGVKAGLCGEWNQRDRRIIQNPALQARPFTFLSQFDRTNKFGSVPKSGKYSKWGKVQPPPQAQNLKHNNYNKYLLTRARKRYDPKSYNTWGPPQSPPLGQNKICSWTDVDAWESLLEVSIFSKICLTSSFESTLAISFPNTLQTWICCVIWMAARF